MLRDLRPAFVFNIVETMAGQGSLIHIAPSILDFLRIPYTGARTEATFLTSNKVLAKQILNAAGIATPPLFLPHENYGGHFVEGTYIIKAVWEHASTWLHSDSIIHAKDPNQLREATASRQKQISMACFAEAFIEGREFNLSLLAGDGGPHVLPPAEIRFDDFPPDKVRVVDYLSKWVEDSFEYHHTPRCFDFPKEDEPLLLLLNGLGSSVLAGVWPARIREGGFPYRQYRKAVGAGSKYKSVPVSGRGILCRYRAIGFKLRPGN